MTVSSWFLLLFPSALSVYISLPLNCANLSHIDFLKAVFWGLAASDPLMESEWREDEGSMKGGWRDGAVPLLLSNAARGQRRSDGRQPLPALAAQLGRLPRGPVIYSAVRRYTVFPSASPGVTASGTPSSRRHSSPAAHFSVQC